MAAAVGASVVVWEWMNEFNRWRPYECDVSNFIEQGRTSGTMLDLCHANMRFSQYTIDFQTMKQKHKYTGTERPIRCQVYPAACAVAQGYIWQFTGDIPGQWNTYDIQESNHIEDMHSQGNQTLLMPSNSSPVYKLDFTRMRQTRLNTGFERQIRRYVFPVPYVTSSTTTGATPNKHNHSPDMSSRKKRKSGRAASHTSSTATFSGLPTGVSHNGITSSSTSAFSYPTAAGHSSFPTAHPGLARSLSVPSSSSHMPGFTFSSTALNPAANMYRPNSSVIHNTGISVKLTSSQMLARYSTVITQIPDNEDCCICCDKLHGTGMADHCDGTVSQLKCGHKFHKSCLVAMYDSGTKDGHIQCPTCKKIYGIKIGVCPAGEMRCSKVPKALPGYEGYGTIMIEYHIRPGIQKAGDPNPGQRYNTTGFPRVAFLPDNLQGKKVDKLLQKAWERRLTFTIGTSTTTGQANTVTWNEIHHKTEVRDNRGHGYPDPNYLDNVTAELAIQGVTEDDIV